MDITAHRIFLNSPLGQLHTYDKALIEETVEKLKTFDKEGVFQIIYSTEGSSGLFSRPRTYMYVIYYTREKVISDCGHDFNGGRPVGDEILSKLAITIRKDCENFFGIVWKNDDSALTQKLNVIIEGNQYILMIKGQDENIRTHLFPITRAAQTVDSNNDVIMEDSSASPDSESEHEIQAQRDSRLADLEAWHKTGDPFSMTNAEITDFVYVARRERFVKKKEARLLQVKDHTTNPSKMKEFNASIQSAIQSVDANTKRWMKNAPELVDDIDQGFPHNIFPRNDSEPRVLISDVFDKGTKVKYDTGDIKKGQEEKKLNESFVVAVIALNSKKVWSCAIIRPQSQHEEFTTTTRCYMSYGIVADTEHSGLRASIGGLIQSFVNNDMEESHVWLLKYLADRLPITKRILQADGKIRSDVLLMTATHDMRAWLDTFDTRLLDSRGHEHILNMFCVFTRTVGFTPGSGAAIRLFIANIPPRNLTLVQIQQIQAANQQKLQNEHMELLKSIKQKFKDTSKPIKDKDAKFSLRSFVASLWNMRQSSTPTLTKVMDICKKFINHHEENISKGTKNAIEKYISYFNNVIYREIEDPRTINERRECAEILGKLTILLNQTQRGGTHKTLKNKNGITKYKLLKHKKNRTQYKVLRNKRFTLKQK